MASVSTVPSPAGNSSSCSSCSSHSRYASLPGCRARMARVYSATFTPRAPLFQRPARAGLLAAARADRGAARRARRRPRRRSADPLGRAAPAILHLAYPAAVPAARAAVQPVGRRLDAEHEPAARLPGRAAPCCTSLWRVGRALWRRLAWSDAPAAPDPGARRAGLLLAALAGRPGAVRRRPALLWHRPMAALAGAGPGDVVFDVHSHTNVSHDVRGTLMRGFDTEANLPVAPAGRVRRRLRHRPQHRRAGSGRTPGRRRSAPASR